MRKAVQAVSSKNYDVATLLARTILSSCLPAFVSKVSSPTSEAAPSRLLYAPASSLAASRILRNLLGNRRKNMST